MNNQGVEEDFFANPMLNGSGWFQSPLRLGDAAVAVVERAQLGDHFPVALDHVADLTTRVMTMPSPLGIFGSSGHSGVSSISGPKTGGRTAALSSLQPWAQQFLRRCALHWP